MCALTELTHTVDGLHAVFIANTAGRLWAAGENKEGQCGLGTPLEELARQHRQAYDNALRRLRIDTQQVGGLLICRRLNVSCRSLSL
jgi:hypothetical protein